MESDTEKLINILKKQAEIFLLDAKEFYPFGTYIDKNDEIVPVGAYLGSDYSPSLILIDLLEKDFKRGIQNGDYKIAAIAIDIIIKENNKNYDAIEVRFFEVNEKVYKRYFKYKVNEHSVDFW